METPGPNEQAYSNALRRFSEIERRDRTACAANCLPYMLTHGRPTKRATLFLHGLSASPRQFAAIAERVYANGDNVFVPRLPRHGYPDRLTDSLKDLKADELLEHARESLKLTRGLADEVRIVGFSLGGLLALWLAEHHDVGETIAIAPLLGLAAVPPRFTPFLASLLKHAPNFFFWWNPLQREKQMPAHGYPRCASHALAESLNIATTLFRAAKTGASNSDITLVLNAGESAVSNSAILELAERWRARGAKIELRRIEGLGPSHDIIEPLRVDARIAKSYPPLYALLEQPRGLKR